MTTKKKTRKVSGNDILPAQEYYRKRADLVEEITDTPIEITYKNSLVNYIGKNDKTKKYEIVIAKPAIKGIPVKTAVYHELSHALHETFMTGILSKLENDSKNTAEELIGKLVKEFDLDDVRPSIIDEVRQRITRVLHKEYKSAYNIMEDQRIESLTGEIWLATKSMFNSTRTALGENYTESWLRRIGEDGMKTPSVNMLFERFNRTDLVMKNEDGNILKDTVHDCEGQSRLIPVVFYRGRVKPIVDEWAYDKLKGYVDEIKDKQKKSDELTDVQDSLDQASNEKQDMPSSSSDPDYDVDKYVEKTKQISDLIQERDKKTKELSDVADNLRDIDHEEHTLARERETQAPDVQHESHYTNYRRQSQVDANEQQDDLSALEDSDEYDGLTEEEIIAREKERAEETIRELKEAIDTMSAPKEPSNIKHVSRDEEDVVLDNNIVSSLSRIITKLKERKVNTLSDTGDEIDMDEYINTRLTGSGEPFITDKISDGISMYITIDGSGSMDGNKIDTARQLVTSLFKIADMNTEIEIKANVWSSDYFGDVGITNIESSSDCSKITTNTNGGSFYQTPTHIALEYSARKLKQMNGRHKLLIMITDGHPQYMKKGFQYPDSTLIKMCIKALRKSVALVPNIMCISIEPYSYGNEILKEIFKKRLVECDGMGNASAFIQKELKRTLVNVFRS